MKKFIFLPLLAFLLPATLSATSPLPGSDIDAHGCIGSAGYVWSFPMRECIRTFDHYSIDAQSPSTGVKKLDALLQVKSDAIIKDFRYNAERDIQALSLSGKTNYELDISYDVVNIGPTISVRMDVYTFLGGAHGESVSYTWNLDTYSGYYLFLPQVLKRRDMPVIAQNIETYLKGTLGDWAVDNDWLRSGLSPKRITNYTTFALHTDANGKIISITFYFADYQVGPHAIGRPTVTVDLATFQVLGE